MKLTRPDVVRARITRERRQRRIAYLRCRRPGSERLAFLEFAEMFARVTDSLRDVMRPAVAVTVQMVNLGEHGTGKEAR